ncbi:MAG: Mrp/NBP35 family ATP-binding protein [Firmicutes bacterium]|nr:Mrp/NBP35 family ATP-binding protein [Bacillota bacterium]
MSLSKKAILSALADFAAPSGVRPLSQGHIQNVGVAPLSDGRVSLILHVDDRWADRPVTDTDLQSLQAFLTRRFPEAAEVQVRLRSHAEAVAAAQAKRAGPAPIQPPVGARLIAVISGKGGVGKSTVSVNLAAALARRGFRTAILDCDIYGFSVPELMGVTTSPKPRQGRWIPPSAHGVEMMSLRFFVPRHAPVMWRGPMLHKALRQMMEDTMWSLPHYMVLDLPPGTGDMALDVHQHFPEAAALLVTTPDPNAAAVAERAGQMALNLGRRLLGVVENLSAVDCPHCHTTWHPLGTDGADGLAQGLGVPVLARIPWVVVGDRGVSGLVPDGHPVQSLYDQLATRVAEADVAPVERRAEEGVR